MEERKTILKSEYIRVLNGTKQSFGGNQGWMDKKAFQNYGCGAVAGSDLTMYLSGEHIFSNIDEYKKRLKKDRPLFPIINHFGISGILLAPCIKLAFIKHKLPYSVRWGVLPKNLRKCCEEMLREDIPVVFSVCQVFQFLWKPAGLQLYTKDGQGSLLPSTRAKSHYMTLTALNGDEMTVSSWGNKYYAKWSEYEHLVRRRSFWYFSNICYVKCSKH